jgi:hypothetical protein
MLSVAIILDTNTVFKIYTCIVEPSSGCGSNCANELEQFKNNVKIASVKKDLVRDFILYNFHQRKNYNS